MQNVKAVNCWKWEWTQWPGPLAATVARWPPCRSNKFRRATVLSSLLTPSTRRPSHLSMRGDLTHLTAPYQALLQSDPARIKPEITDAVEPPPTFTVLTHFRDSLTSTKPATSFTEPRWCFQSLNRSSWCIVLHEPCHHRRCRQCSGHRSWSATLPNSSSSPTQLRRELPGPAMHVFLASARTPGHALL